MGSNKLITVVIPSDEEIERLKELGIDIESHFVRVFVDELHNRLHPEDKIQK